MIREQISHGLVYEIRTWVYEPVLISYLLIELIENIVFKMQNAYITLNMIYKLFISMGLVEERMILFAVLRDRAFESLNL